MIPKIILGQSAIDAGAENLLRLASNLAGSETTSWQFGATGPRRVCPLAKP